MREQALEKEWKMDLTYDSKVSFTSLNLQKKKSLDDIEMNLSKFNIYNS